MNDENPYGSANLIAYLMLGAGAFIAGLSTIALLKFLVWWLMA